jgi:hypothetical protein
MLIQTNVGTDYDTIHNFFKSKKHSNYLQLINYYERPICFRYWDEVLCPFDAVNNLSFSKKF